ncbi:PTH2-domain-containing protein [Guyanagaster necrorhizus]|uniref:peptidyl-tRNA hydrolase n=1 Tax=Guyanagaster necrorhizus TaxID=856835 RepID=A0A9P7W0Q9_9AGAR|nr:PTH2-domain-containing protein [Guyanagaster necrorhizus MCA 3950]KAG7450265.1 PTH2-domain-containing protein [Guyanagaster necrorhizus MCA 3950]
MQTFGSSSAGMYGVVVAVTFAIGLWVGSNVSPRRPVKSEKPHGQAIETVAKGTEAAGLLHGNDEDNESDEDQVSGDLSSLKIGPTEECTMVLVVREDLGMTSGKIAAQCSHAVLACYKSMLSSNVPLLRRWERAGRPKLTRWCSDEEILLELQALAQSLNLCTRSIQDAGRTQIEAGSRTVLGIVGPVDLVRRVTGTLRPFE